MKRKMILLVLLAAVLLVSGCAKRSAEPPAPLEELEILDPGFVSEPPAGIQPLAERKDLENHIEPPESTSVVRAGEISYICDEIALVLDGSATKARATEIAAQYGYTVVGYIDVFSTAQLRCGASVSLEQIESVCALMEKEADVCCATPHYLRRSVSQTLPTDDWKGDPLDVDIASGCNWGMEAIGGVWLWENYPDIPSMRLGVIDTSFDVNHDDVRFAQLLHSDVYYDMNKKTDDASHGTFVAGIIGAVHNNKKGSAGLLKDCELVGSSLSGVQEEASCLVELSLIAELSSYGIDIMNYSMGYTADMAYALNASVEPALRAYENEVKVCTAAFNNFLSKGYDLLLVCAAGNSGADARFTSMFNGITDPVLIKHILVVGAAELVSDNTYAAASYSSKGDRVDVYAPGSGIYSCANRHGYAVMNGTSVAAPHAAGACAAVGALHADLSCTDMRTWIVMTADIPVNGTEKLMIDLRPAVVGRTSVSFSNVEWEKYDNIPHHMPAIGYDEPTVHVIAEGNDIEFHGYNVSAMNEGVRYMLQPGDEFTIECDIDASTILTHPAGYLDISLGLISVRAGIFTDYGQFEGHILMDDQQIMNVGKKFHLKMSYSAGGQYEVAIDGKTVGSLFRETDSSVEVRFGFAHASHACAMLSHAYVRDISMSLCVGLQLRAGMQNKS